MNGNQFFYLFFTISDLFQVTYHFNISQKSRNGRQWEPTLSVLSSSLDVFNLLTPAFLLPLTVSFTNSFELTEMDKIFFSFFFAERLPLFLSDPLKLNNDACAKINSMIIPCYEDLIELKSDHNHKIVEITDNTGKCLLDEYIVSFKISILTNQTATYQRHCRWF